MKGFLILMVAGFVAWNNAFSQKIEKQIIWPNSLEGKPSKIIIETDEVHDKIILISPASDTLYINGYRGFENIRTFEGEYILIFFGIRGGSNEEDARTVLVCVSNGHLYKALDIHSFQDYLYNQTYTDKRIDSLGLFYESGTHKVDLLNIESDNKNNSRLTVTEYDRVTSKQNPNNNHETLNIFQFQFDKKLKIFYNLKDTLNGTYLVGLSNKTRTFNGTKYPAIKLKNDEYLFIDGIWYMKGTKNHLFTYSDI